MLLSAWLCIASIFGIKISSPLSQTESDRRVAVTCEAEEMNRSSFVAAAVPDARMHAARGWA